MKNLWFVFLIILIGCDLGKIEEYSFKSANIESSVIVKFKKNVNQNIVIKNNGFLKNRIKDDIVVLTGASVEYLNNLPEVQYAQVDQHIDYCEISNDTYFLNGELWAVFNSTSSIQQNEYAIDAITPWANGHVGSKSVYVAVVDGGIQTTHEDLVSNFVTEYGYDFHNNDITVWDKGDVPHATHISGTIGAIGGNGKGIAGVCWKVSLIPIKVMDNRGGNVSDAIRALYYLIDLKKAKGLDIVAINCSWGWLGDFNQAFYDVAMECNDNGIILVCAAGNNSINMDSFDPTFQAYPAAFDCPNIISVGAIGWYGEMMAWSNYGATMVDIAAPGDWIKSCVPVGGKVKIGYDWMKGTSMAAPHVTGAVALYKSIHPMSNISEIKQAILYSAIPTASFVGKCVTGGRLNVGAF